MTELENLQIVIDVVDSFEDELDKLILKLAEVQGTVEAVDPVTIDVNVRGKQQLRNLMAQMGALQAMDTAGVGNVDANVSGGGGGRRGATVGSAVLFEALSDSIGESLDSLNDSINAVSDDFVDSMGNTMSAADKAADQFDITNLRMADLHNAVARILPLLAVFIGALPAVITGLVAVGAAAISAAAGLAALTGFGALGAAMARDGDIGEGFMSMVEDIQEDFLDAFGPLARRLAPLFEDFLDGLGRFFQEVANQGDILLNLRDDARAFATFFGDFVRETAAAMGRMADVFRPLFSQIGAFIDNMDLLFNLTRFLGDILPELRTFIVLSIGAIKRIVQMSEGFLIVATAIGVLLSGFFTIIDIIPFVSNEVIGGLIATLLVAATAAAIFGNTLVAKAAAGMVTFGASIVRALPAIGSYITAQFGATLATGLLSKAVLFLIGVLTLGIGALVAAGAAATVAGGMFQGFTDDVDMATQSLRAFRREQRRMSSGQNPFADPNIQRGDARAMAGGNTLNMTINGGDEEDTEKQMQNGLYRLDRKGRR